MLFVGYFEGLASQRGIAWRCSDSRSLQEFLDFLPHEAIPDHSSMTTIRQRLPEVVGENVFAWVLKLAEDQELSIGKNVGVDATTQAPADPDAKIAKRKDGTTHLASKAEHVVDLATELVLGAEIHAADKAEIEKVKWTRVSTSWRRWRILRDRKIDLHLCLHLGGPSARPASPLDCSR